MLVVLFVYSDVENIVVHDVHTPYLHMGNPLLMQSVLVLVV